MTAFEERQYRLWYSGHDSSELEVVTNPRALRALVEARGAVGRPPPRDKRREADEAARRQREAFERYARYVDTVGKSFNPILATKVEEIQKVVCAFYRISRVDFLSQRRTVAICRARHVAMYFAKVFTRHSWSGLGRKFGNRDHSTIMHGYSKIERELTTDPMLAAEVAELRATLEKQYARAL